MSDPTDNSKKQIKIGIVGTTVTAICCFTPLLVIGFGLVGLSAWVSGLDYVLFPALFASLGLTAHAFYVRAGKPGPRPTVFIAAAVLAFSGLLFWLEFRFALRITLAAAAAVAAYVVYLRAAASRLTPAKEPK